MATGSASKINLWRRCRKKAWYHDILGLERNIQSILPVRGTVIHACLQNLYGGKDWTTPVGELRVDLDNVFDEERELWATLPQEIYRIVRGYMVAYREADSKLNTLALERRFDLPLGKHTYKGTIDWIFADKDGIWVADHKTVKSIPDVSELYMDLQTMMYAEAVKQGAVELPSECKGENIAGVVFNHIRTKAPSTPHILKNGSISKAACDTDVATFMETVKANGLDPKDYVDMIEKLKGNMFYRRVRIPVQDRTVDIIKSEIITTLDEIEFYTKKAEQLGSKASVLFPRNMMKMRCAWDCEYNKICFGELAGMNTKSMIENDYRTRELRYDDENIEE